MTNEEFGRKLAALRKERDLTQKQLGEKLFVSDTSVSKWERGISMPNVFLLLPLAEALDVSLETLLGGEEQLPRMQKQIQAGKRGWILAFFLSLLLFAGELLLLLSRGMGLESLMENVLVTSILMLVFGGYFVFFIPALLPSYYDKEKIGSYSHGPLRINLPYIHFHNGNWFFVCRFLKACCLSLAVLFPLFPLLLGPVLWAQWDTPLLILSLAVFVAGLYITAYRHK